MRLRNKVTGTLGWFVGILTIFLYAAGGLIHLWTILIAFYESGFVASAITFFFPVVSQAYWIFYISSGLGTFINTFTMILAGYLLGWLTVIVLGFISSHFYDDKASQSNCSSEWETAGTQELLQVSSPEDEDNLEDNESDFIGPNAADYYKPNWRIIKESGKKISWNWAAFIFSSYWLVYRKMYAIFFIYTILLASISGLTMYLGYTQWVAYLPLKIVLALFGNYLYFKHFKRKTRPAKEYGITNSSFFQKKGGVSKLSVVMYIIIAIILNFYLTYY